MQETQETQVQPLGQGDPLEKGMAIHSSILAWEIPWTGYNLWDLKESDMTECSHTQCGILKKGLS